MASPPLARTLKTSPLYPQAASPVGAASVETGKGHTLTLLGSRVTSSVLNHGLLSLREASVALCIILRHDPVYLNPSNL